MKIEDALRGLKDAEAQLSTKHATSNPALISEQMYRLGQYASALEQFLGDAEEEYEREWAAKYKDYTTDKRMLQVDPDNTFTDPKLVGDKPLSATAAKQAADVDMAEAKGNIKKLQRYVSAAWHVHMSCMARHKHLANEMKGSV